MLDSTPVSFDVTEENATQEGTIKLVKVEKPNMAQNPDCGRYFIAKRKTAMYCSYPAPQDEKRSCKKVYPQITSQRRRNGDAARKAYRNTQSKLIHRRTANPDIEKYRQNVDDLQKKYKEKKEAVDNGTMSLKEFKDWCSKTQSPTRR